MTAFLGLDVGILNLQIYALNGSIFAANQHPDLCHLGQYSLATALGVIHERDSPHRYLEVAIQNVP
jgi:hypothetical protein